MFRESSLPRLKRLGCGIVGVVATALGFYYSRDTYAYSYRNWFGGLVFGPVAIVLGMVALLGAVLNWPKICDSPPRDHARKKPRVATRDRSIRRFIIAGLSAGFAVIETVDAQSYIELRLAEHAEFLAPATRLRRLALGADDLLP
jgi:hypothetical protein